MSAVCVGAPVARKKIKKTMAYNNIEVEIKLEVSENLYLKLVEQLTLEANYLGEEQQIDRYFSTGEEGYIDNEEFPYRWLSIRERGLKKILNFKFYYPPGEKIHEYCDEYEVEIDNVNSMASILKQFKANEIVTVEKRRKKFKYKDDFEIVLDQVIDLGYFIEVESIRDFGGTKVTRQKILDYMLSLNLEVGNHDLRGYPYLIKERNRI